MKKVISITAFILAITFICLETQSQNQKTINVSKSDLANPISQDIDKPVYFDNDNPPGGIFIFEGEENAPGYSGTYIKEIFDQLGIDYTYSNTYPATLLGYETVFVSHSNIGENLSMGTGFTIEHSLMFQEFLESGGNMYVDMGSMFTLMDYLVFSNAAEMRSLFGVESNTIHLEGNNINSLVGTPGSVMENIHFDQSNQRHSFYIDDLEVTEDAVATFTEIGYGTVSVMNDGASTFGHKTFYLGYSLAELVDIDPLNSKNNVLLKILDFFEMLPEGYLLSGFMADKHDGPTPLEVQFTDASFSDPEHPIQSWAWDFNNDGEVDSDEQNPSWTFNAPGEHNITLIVTNDLQSDTLAKHSFITVNHGYLVYEGRSNAEGYSGTFIKNYMEENNYNSVTYRDQFPDDLEGYHTVFLSFGNWDTGNTFLHNYMADIIINFIEGGGFVYLEGGGSFFQQRYNEEFQELFGVDTALFLGYNSINYLEGKSDALTVDQVFTSSSQLGYTWVNVYVPNESGIIAFEESDYGVVAIQNTGEYNHRTFCFSYTLAELDDGDFPGTRAEFLNRICNFFDINTSFNSPVDKKLELEIYPNPVQNIASFSSKEITSIEIYDMMGALIIKRSNNKVDMSNLPSGIYFVIGLDKNNYPLYKGKVIKK